MRFTCCLNIGLSSTILEICQGFLSDVTALQPGLIITSAFCLRGDDVRYYVRKFNADAIVFGKTQCKENGSSVFSGSLVEIR